eukprot:14195468-Alexandrium_andersonii.AAC.1
MTGTYPTRDHDGEEFPARSFRRKLAGYSSPETSAHFAEHAQSVCPSRASARLCVSACLSVLVRAGV